MMMFDPRKSAFDAARLADEDGVLVLDDIAKIHAALDAAGVPRSPAPAKGRQINAAGFDMIKHFEGCKLTTYRDIAGIWTIGWGHTGPDVTPGKVISQAEADALLDTDLDKFEAAVERMARAPAANQFAALVSLAYNIGAGEGGLKSSTLLRLHNAGDFAGAADQFGRWNKARVGGKLVAVNGLTRRRAAEAELYRRVA